MGQVQIGGLSFDVLVGMPSSMATAKIKGSALFPL